MSIESIQLLKLANLARLQIVPENSAALTKDLQNILRMIDDMRAADTSGSEPLHHPLDITQPLREDRVTEIVDRDALQCSSAAVRDGYYLVPRVVD